MQNCTFLNDVPKYPERLVIKKVFSSYTKTIFEVYNGDYTEKEAANIKPVCYIEHDRWGKKKKFTIFNINWDIIAFCYKKDDLFIVTKCLLPLAVFKLGKPKNKFMLQIIICYGEPVMDIIEYFDLLINTPQGIDDALYSIQQPIERVKKTTKQKIKQIFKKCYDPIKIDCVAPTTPLIQICASFAQRYYK